MSSTSVTEAAPAATEAKAPSRSVKGRDGGDLRRRLIRHYLPLTLGSLAALVLFVNVPFFDANRYPPPGDIFTAGVSGAIPSGEPQGSSGSSGEMPPGMQHGPGQGMPPGMQHGPGQSMPPGMPGMEGMPGAQGSGSQGMPGMQNGSGESGGGASAGRNMDAALRWRLLSTASGYVALALLALTLLIGPVNLLLRRRNPVSSYFRRDIGIFSAFGSVAHMVFGFLVKHQDGQILGYFFAAGDRSKVLTNSFGLANWTGLLAVLIVAGLAVISSDVALRKLRAKRWKMMQRLNYGLFVLVILHSLFYGALWRTTSPYTVMLGLSVVAVAVLQALGVRLWRRKKGRTAPAGAATVVESPA